MESPSSSVKASGSGRPGSVVVSGMNELPAVVLDTLVDTLRLTWVQYGQDEMICGNHLGMYLLKSVVSG